MREKAIWSQRGGFLTKADSLSSSTKKIRNFSRRFVEGFLFIVTFLGEKRREREKERKKELDKERERENTKKRKKERKKERKKGGVGQFVSVLVFFSLAIFWCHARNSLRRLN